MTTVLISILIADWLTGFFHWLEDNYATPNWPFRIGISNIEHHQWPGLMGRMGSFVSRNLIPVAMAGIGWPLGYWFGLPAWPLLLVCGFAAMGNEVHVWNHRAKNNALIEFLKDTGIFQTSRQHARHHRPPYERTYCTLLNFNNAWLDRVQFWRGLELCFRLCGLHSKRGSACRDGF